VGNVLHHQNPSAHLTRHKNILHSNWMLYQSRQQRYKMNKQVMLKNVKQSHPPYPKKYYNPECSSHCMASFQFTQKLWWTKVYVYKVTNLKT